MEIKFFINNKAKYMNQLSQSEENKSSSGTSESEKYRFNKKLSTFQYSIMPKKILNTERMNKEKK